MSDDDDVNVSLFLSVGVDRCQLIFRPEARNMKQNPYQSPQTAPISFTTGNRVGAVCDTGNGGGVASALQRKFQEKKQETYPMLLVLL